MGLAFFVLKSDKAFITRCTPPPIGVVFPRGATSCLNNYCARRIPCPVAEQRAPCKVATTMHLAYFTSIDTHAQGLHRRPQWYKLEWNVFPRPQGQKCLLEIRQYLFQGQLTPARTVASLSNSAPCRQSVLYINGKAFEPVANIRGAHCSKRCPRGQVAQPYHLYRTTSPPPTDCCRRK